MINALLETLFALGPYLPWISAGLVLLALAGLVALIVYMRRSAKPSPEDVPPPDADEPAATDAAASPAAPPVEEEPARGYRRRWADFTALLASSDMGRSFADAIRLLRRHVTGRNFRYEIPWFVMLGSESAGKSSVLASLRMALPFGRPASPGAPRAGTGVTWWFYDRGVVLDLGGEHMVPREEKDDTERNWRRFLRLLSRHRPRRPVDGVVLAVSCEDLVGPRALSPEALAARAEAANHRLWEMQKTLGICFPVYVLVTKTDRVRGFEEFWASVPESRRDDMLGWSSPYTLDTAFAPHWVEEGFESITRSLGRLQLEIAAGGGVARENDAGGIGGDGLFLFPQSFRTLSEPLGRYLNQVFKPSVYHESFFFRGFYFTGAAPSLQPETLHAAPEDALRPILVNDLFEHKVFPEAGLARPAGRALVSRNRAVIATQGALAASVLVGGVGLAWDYTRLSSEVSVLRPVLQDIGEDMRTLRQKELRIGPYADLDIRQIDFLEADAGRTVLDLMGRIQGTRLWSVFMPRSWFAGTERDVIRFLTEAFDRVILRAMHDQIDQRVTRLLDTPVPPAREEERVPALEQMPEFQRLSGFLEDLRELEEHIALYNRLGATQRVEDFERLVRFLLGTDLPSAFVEHSDFFQRALTEISYQRFDPARHQARARARAREMTWRVFDRLFYTGPVTTQVHALTARILALEEPGHTVRSDAVALQNVLEAVGRTREVLEQPEFRWLFRDTFDPGDAFRRAMGLIDASPFLGPDLVREILQTGEGEFRRLKRRLEAYRTRLTGPILDTRSGEGAGLSTSVTQLEALLRDLFDQRFMAVREQQDIVVDLGAAHRLMWNTDRLHEALRLYEAFDRFSANQVPLYPDDLQRRVRALAKARLEAGMVTSIAYAQEVQPATQATWRSLGEAEIANEIRSFRRAAPVIEQLLLVLEQLDMRAVHEPLHEVATAQAYGLLDRIDMLLESEGVYRPGPGLSRWDGVGPVTIAAFNIRDDVEIEHYLQFQRDRISHLGREYAEPLLLFLSGAAVRERGAIPLALRWERILTEQTKYFNRRPDSTLVTLERFIRFEMNRIGRDNCLEETREAEGRLSGDFFLQRRAELLQQIGERCRELAFGQVIAQYGRIAEAFNARLAGRYPFAAPRAEGEEVSIESIRAFYRVHDDNAARARELLEAAPNGPGRQTALDFLRDLERVRAFLSPILDAPVDDRVAAGLSFDVDFRVNRAFEAGANRVIEWSLRKGERTIRLEDEDRQALWQPGQPVRLSMRWARDAAESPVPTGVGMRVEGRTAIFDFDGKWSLLRLLEAHAAPPEFLPERSDPRPHTLMFNVTTGVPLETGGERFSSQAVLFNRIGVFREGTEADGPQRVTKPDFPRRAPAYQPDGRRP